MTLKNFNQKEIIKKIINKETKPKIIGAKENKLLNKKLLNKKSKWSSKK